MYPFSYLFIFICIKIMHSSGLLLLNPTHEHPRKRKELVYYRQYITFCSASFRCELAFLPQPAAFIRHSHLIENMSCSRKTEGTQVQSWQFTDRLEMVENISEVSRLYLYKPRYSLPSLKSIILKSCLGKYVFSENKSSAYQWQAVRLHWDS